MLPWTAPISLGAITFLRILGPLFSVVSWTASSTNRMLSFGVPTELIRGDVLQRGAIGLATLISTIPPALLYNAFLNKFIAGFTGGAFR